MDLSPELLRDIVAQMIILVLSIAIHEFGHAFVADRLGDPLPRSEGRVTLNPLVHADPIGTLALPFFGMLLSHGMGGGFGWGRPVRVNPLAFTRKYRMKTGHMFVAAAGPAMNILLGLILGAAAMLLVKFGVFAWYSLPVRLMTQAGMLNFILAFFNLVPAPPLDGGAVLEGLLPDRYRSAFAQYAQYGVFVVMAVLFVPGLSTIFTWPALQCYRGWLGLLG